MARIIHIMNFINPHCFFFKFDDDLHDSQLQNLEDEISIFARSKVNESIQYTPKKGDIVAAYEISWGKWVRAEVHVNLNKFERCQLWAIDHGKHFQTAYKNIVQLSQHLIDRKAKGIHQGSIFGISPACLDLNMETLEAVLTPCEDWPQSATVECKRFINRDDVLKVLYNIKEKRGNYFFGDLSIESLPKMSTSICIVDLGGALVSIDKAIRAEFQKEMDRIAFRYESPFDENISETDTDSQSIITVIPNVKANGIRLKLMKVVNQQQNHAPEPSIAPSRAESTVIPSEINGGMTRMNVSNRLRNPAQSIAPSTIVPSEIEGGATRMNMSRMNRSFNPSEDTNRHNMKQGRAHMPAGFEPDSHSFDKHNKRF